MCLLLKDIPSVPVYIVQLIVSVVLPFLLLLFLARIPKNPIVLNPLWLELEAQSWRIHIHQFKYITIPNPFITHFGDGGWVPGELQTHLLDLLSTRWGAILWTVYSSPNEASQRYPVPDLDLQREMRPRRWFEEPFQLNTKLLMPANN